jgi:plasmid stabilization system protein ParE
MSDLYKLIILPEAQQDIRNIVLYIARDLAAPQAALNLQDEFEKEIRSLAKMPKRIRKVDEQPWKDCGIRKTRVKNYYIYFLVDDAEMAVKVNAVIYIGRDQTKQMTDRKMEKL